MCTSSPNTETLSILTHFPTLDCQPIIERLIQLFDLMIEPSKTVVSRRRTPTRVEQQGVSNKKDLKKGNTTHTIFNNTIRSNGDIWAYHTVLSDFG